MPPREARQPAVHPRARGEQAGSGLQGSWIDGSSPRTRGTAVGSEGARPGRRFIPAHAGNSPIVSACHCSLPVHPRARGEQGLRPSASRTSSGSSPRTRGTGCEALCRAALRRFIPAHAGNRRAAARIWSATTVHPRARGEQPAPQLAAVTQAGSSPRTRGTVEAEAGELERVRFIPAHAGNSTAAAWQAICQPVHPRARGEQARAGHGNLHGGGSSPRTRGTGVMTAG